MAEGYGSLQTVHRRRAGLLRDVRSMGEDSGGLARLALLAWAALEVEEHGHQKPWEALARQSLEDALTRLRGPGGGFIREAEGADGAVYPGENGLMIAALARGSRVLGEKRYLRAAEAARLFIKTRLTDPEGYLYRLWRDGEAVGRGHREDYALYILALGELHRAGGSRFCLREAMHLADQMAALFGPEAVGE